ncbi:MAG: hypothetical protein U0T81_02245 [Saprospiraceae bacterium]
MKVRIQAQSIRFRLNKEDVKCLGNERILSQHTLFSAQPVQELGYTIKWSEGEKTQIEFKDRMITLGIRNRSPKSLFLAMKRLDSQRISFWTVKTGFMFWLRKTFNALSQDRMKTKKTTSLIPWPSKYELFCRRI